MSYVDLDLKNLVRILSIRSELFGDKPMTEDDKKLRQKLEVMVEAEKEADKAEFF